MCENYLKKKRQLNILQSNINTQNLKKLKQHFRKHHKKTSNLNFNKKL